MRLKGATATWASTSAALVSQPRLMIGASAVAALLMVTFPRENDPESVARMIPRPEPSGPTPLLVAYSTSFVGCDLIILVDILSERPK